MIQEVLRAVLYSLVFMVALPIVLVLLYIVINVFAIYSLVEDIKSKYKRKTRQ